MPGFKMMLDVPKRCQPLLGNPNVGLVITEGSKKADAGASRSQEVCYIALQGVYNFRGKNEHGGIVALPDRESIALNDGRLTYITFDSDVMTKPEVEKALLRLKPFLEMRGAKVRIVYLAPKDGGAKQGLDDFLAAGHTIEDVFALASDRPQPASGGNQRGQYFEEKGRLWWQKDAATKVPLTNFTGRILTDLIIDDGTDTAIREYEIRTKINGVEVEPFRLPASKFYRMEWVPDNLGSSAIIEVVNRGKDHIAAAIKKFSAGQTIDRRVFAHTGWREISGCSIYLHGGGGIDQSGLRTDVTVEIGRELPVLRNFVLPAPVAGADLVTAVEASLQMLALGPYTVTAPVWCAIWRAVIDVADFSIHLDGKTGAFKTELAALSMQHFGAGFDSRHLPASWHNSALANEAITFILKDALTVIDDFKPIGSSIERQKLHADADKLLRAQANAAGRTKLHSDSSVRSPREPRGLSLSTGEETPAGESLGARVWVAEVQRGDIDKAKLTECQDKAHNGLYAKCMASFVQWLAPQRTAVLAEMKQELKKLRTEADLASHPRTPGVVGDLFFGAKEFFRFAADVGAVTQKEADGYLKENDGAGPHNIWDALIEVSKTRNRDIRNQGASRRFLDLVGSAFVAGRAHVVGVNGAAPCNPESWGWRKGQFRYDGDPADSTWNPQGDCVGWSEGDDVYLDPAAAYRAAQAMASGANSIGVEERTVWKRLADDKLLASTGYD
ncbi:MAG: DUF3854 domain-containing protein, partial [Candidatus Sulfotelmatobacter sp.]